MLDPDSQEFKNWKAYFNAKVQNTHIFAYGMTKQVEFVLELIEAYELQYRATKPEDPRKEPDQ